MAALWSVGLQFFLVTAAIAVSGAQLCRYGDVLAEKTGMGRTWLGLVVLAAVTSLPETATGVSAVLWVNAPDITVGDLLGSCVFNLLILAVVDILYPPGPALTVADRGHLLAAAFGVVMLGVARHGGDGPFAHVRFDCAHVGLSGPVLLVCYLVAMRSVFRYQLRERAAYLEKYEEELAYEGISLRTAVRGVWAKRPGGGGRRHLACPGRRLIWPDSWAGTSPWWARFLWLPATSLPELVVTLKRLAAGRRGPGGGQSLRQQFDESRFAGGDGLHLFAGPHCCGWRLQQPCGHRGDGHRDDRHRHRGTDVPARRRKALRWMSLGAFCLAFLYAAHIFLQMLAQ